MRKPSTAILVASVAIALTGSAAFAQSMSAPRANPSVSTSTTASTPLIAPRASAGSNTSANTGRTGSGNANIGATGNGSTSATGTASVGNPTVLTNADGSKTSTTLNADGSRTIVSMNLDGSPNIQTVPANLFNPPAVSGTVGVVTAEEAQINRNAAALEAQGSTASAEVLRSSVSIDRVIRSAEKDRKKIGKNGQLLSSITPRTNADRSNEMRDDAPRPALSGLANSVSQR